MLGSVAPRATRVRGLTNASGGGVLARVLQDPSLRRAFSPQYGLAVGGASSAFPPCSLPPPSPRNSANSLQCKLTDPQFPIFQTNPERCQKVLLASLTPGRVSAQGSPAPAPSRISKCPGVGGSGGQLWPAWERLFPLPFEVLAPDWQVPHLYNL